jgi:hypothetical protein
MVAKCYGGGAWVLSMGVEIESGRAIEVFLVNLASK